MNIVDLKFEISRMKIPDRAYSINGNVGSNKFVLRKVYSFWEYFYVDERGGENGYKRFSNEEDACEFFLEKMKNEEKYYK